jgi:GNAT superfamily N-acetyltransferase
VQFEVRALRPDEVPTAAELVGRVFMECVAPLYSAEGIKEFLSYASPEALTRRLRSQLEILVAVDEGEVIVGVVGVRDHCHISLLFVESGFQRMGIGRRLVEAVVEACKEVNPIPTEVTVNASPNSVEAYERYGFIARGPDQEKNGIRFVPMGLTIG